MTTTLKLASFDLPRSTCLIGLYGHTGKESKERMLRRRKIGPAAVSSSTALWYRSPATDSPIHQLNVFFLCTQPHTCTSKQGFGPFQGFALHMRGAALSFSRYEMRDCDV